MSSACTCHINKDECLWCLKRIRFEDNGNIILINDEHGSLTEFQKHEDGNLYVCSENGDDRQVAGSKINKKQLKELMLFLDRKYGYLLEGVK